MLVGREMCLFVIGKVEVFFLRVIRRMYVEGFFPGVLISSNPKL